MNSYTMIYLIKVNISFILATLAITKLLENRCGSIKGYNKINKYLETILTGIMFATAYILFKYK